jgi:hypothetical protein
MNKLRLDLTLVLGRSIIFTWNQQCHRALQLVSDHRQATTLTAVVNTGWIRRAHCLLTTAADALLGHV